VKRLFRGRVAAFFRARMAVWVRRRQGEDTLPAVLARRRLYILPTRAGLAFGALWLLMLLAGLNYGNSLALFLTFLLAGFALVAMHECHRNLLGLRLVAVSAPAVFARGAGAVLMTLENPGTPARLALEAALEGEPLAGADLPAHGRVQLSLPVAAARRGVVRIERMRLTTSHPFGLFRTWTWVHLPVELLVYPYPSGERPRPMASGRRQTGARSRGTTGADEWVGLRPFRDGDSPRQVDWKAYARQAPLLVKEYSPTGADLCLFDFTQLAIPDLEARLSQLARWVVEAESVGDHYGLTLPGTVIAPNRGPEHRHRCLAALALYGTEPPAWSARAPGKPAHA
jgi:uncharacterized protein (DUF58 family)